MPCFFESRPILSGLTEALSVSFILSSEGVLRVCG